MNRYNFILLISAVWLAACTNNPLKQDYVKEEVEKYYQINPKEATGNTAFVAVIKGKDSANNNILFRLYINDGLLELSKTKVSANSDSIFIYDVTEKGKPYLIKKTLTAEGYPVLVVKTFEYYLQKITSIKYSSDKKKAEAHYELAIRNLTPFGKVADRNHKMYMIAFFRLEKDKWMSYDIKPDFDKYD
jgi:hypothetical protein